MQVEDGASHLATVCLLCEVHDNTAVEFLRTAVVWEQAFMIKQRLSFTAHVSDNKGAVRGNTPCT